jgi:hypothetical protein
VRGRLGSLLLGIGVAHSFSAFAAPGDDRVAARADEARGRDPRERLVLAGERRDRHRDDGDCVLRVWVIEFPTIGTLQFTGVTAAGRLD